MAKEIYKATVSRNNDDKKLGRIKVSCQGLSGHGKELAYWCEPIFPFVADGWGFFVVPEVGDEVEIEVTVHDVTDETHAESIITNPDIRYRAGAYSPGQKVPDELKKNYGKRIGMKTRAGHLFYFDDSSGNEEVTLTAAKGNVNINALGTGATVNINGSDYSLPKLETLLSDLNTLATKLVAWVPLVVTAVAAVPSGAAVDPGVVAAASAIVSAVSAGSYKSTKGKNG